MNELREKLIAIADELEELYKKYIENEDFQEFQEHFDDVLDIEYKIGGDLKYRSVKLALTLGGPNIYLDTETMTLRGYWGIWQEEIAVDRNVSNAIDDIFEEYFNCL